MSLITKKNIVAPGRELSIIIYPQKPMMWNIVQIYPRHLHISLTMQKTLSWDFPTMCYVSFKDKLNYNNPMSVLWTLRTQDI